MAWSVSVTVLCMIVVYHQLSGYSSNIWNGDDRKNDTTICRIGVKCSSNSFKYDCCLSSIVRIFIVFLEWSWQESDTSICRKGVKCFSNSFIYDCCISSIVRIFIDYFKKSKKRWQEERHLNLSKRAWKDSVTALYTIVVYHQFSGSSSNIWNGVDRKSNTWIFWVVVKCFSNSFLYDCCISSIVRIFMEYLK